MALGRRQQFPVKDLEIGSGVGPLGFELGGGEHGEDLERLQRNAILIDGAPADGQGLLLQIFTETVIGPIFFEIIQRKGNEGFGEGNFQALFESMEEDQLRRGTLKTSPGEAGSSPGEPGSSSGESGL